MIPISFFTQLVGGMDNGASDGQRNTYLYSASRLAVCLAEGLGLAVAETGAATTGSTGAGHAGACWAGPGWRAGAGA